MQSTPASSKGHPRKSRAAATSEPESSENEGTPCSTTASLPLSSSVNRSSIQDHHSPSDQLEKSDRISKEKQKFFKRAAQKKRLDATSKTVHHHNANHLNSKTPKNVNSDVSKTRIESVGKRVNSNSRTRDINKDAEPSDNSKVAKKRDGETKCITRTSVKSKDNKSKVVPVSARVSKNKIISKTLVNKNKKLASKPVNTPKETFDASEVEEKTQNEADCDSSIDSSEECSSSSVDESSSIDSDSDSSAHPSEASRLNLPGPKLKPSRSLLVSATNTSMNTFGSVGGITHSKDTEVWGFAAAAAQAKKNNIFGQTDAAKTETKVEKSENLSSQVDDKSSNSTSNSSTSSGDRLKPGYGQLRGLFDGLSHLFTTGTNRSRTNTIPNYSLSRKKKPSEKQTEKEATNKTEIIEEKRPKIELKTTNPENAVGIANVLVQQSNITLPPKILRRITPQTVPLDKARSRKPTEEPSPRPQMTPSNLVKTAVNSKRHELERRNFLKGEVGLGGLGYSGFSYSSLLEDIGMKKRYLIAEATQLSHPLSVPQPSNNQPGKMGHRTHLIWPVLPTSPIPRPAYLTVLSLLQYLSHLPRPGYKHT